MSPPRGSPLCGSDSQGCRLGLRSLRRSAAGQHRWTPSQDTVTGHRHRTASRHALRPFRNVQTPGPLPGAPGEGPERERVLLTAHEMFQLNYLLVTSKLRCRAVPAQKRMTAEID